MPRLPYSLFLLLLLVKLTAAQSPCPPDIQTRVLLLGDSWTHIMWDNLTYRDVFNQFGFADKIERGNNTAIGGTTASYWALPANISVIQNELLQNPTIDIVLLSIGGNDMLAGMNGPQPGWHTGLNSADEALLFDRIQADIQTIIDGIKSVRPNIEIVFSGYDYVNLVETVINDQTGAIVLTWANLGQPNALQLNSAFARMEQRKVNIANADARVHYVQGFGLMQHVFGYPGLFPAFSVPAPGQQPPSYVPFPGGNPNYPTPPVALADNGSDAIHLSDDGYKHLVVNQTNAYFLHKFRGNPNATFRSEGGLNDGWVRSDGTLGVGGIRAGDNGASHLYRGIISFNTAAIPDNATITGASLFLNRASLSGINPFSSGLLGAASVDVKTGTLGAAGIEITDYFAAADATNAGCFIGTAPANGYTIRIDFTSTGFSKINKAGQTQFRIYFQNANGALNDYIQFNNGDQAGLLAPYLDVFYSIPPAPATSVLSGDATICPGENAALHISFTGTAPWTITWSDGVTETNIQSANHTRVVSPTTSTLYSIVAIADANGTGTATGSVQIEVLPDVAISVTGLNGNYCANSPVTILIASPPGGVWTGAGLSGNTFNPALAVVHSGGGLITLNYSGSYNGCNYAKDFSVFVDSNSCSQTGSCAFSPVSGAINCVAASVVTKAYQSSGRLWVFEDLLPGKTYVASTCDSCGFDSFLMIRDEADSSFIAENDDACGVNASVTFVAPSSGKVGVNLTGERTFNCNGYPCNPHDCNPYDCNPYNCNPAQCNCQTCYETCYRDDQVFMTCYPGGIQVINGLLTSDCIGACTGGFCWRIQYQVPYDCNPYTCNCQTCYQTCYDTCYETCYDTCYQTCIDKCGTDNFIACDVKLICMDCTVPVASIAASSNSACETDSISFTASIPDATCNTSYFWDFGADAIPSTSTSLNPQNIIWTTSGVKQISFHVTEPGVGTNAYQLAVRYHQQPSGGVLHFPSDVCNGDTVYVSLDSVQHASSYSWEFSTGAATGTGATRNVIVADSPVDFFVVPFDGACIGDTFRGIIQPHTVAPPLLTVNGNTISTSAQYAGYQWYLDGVALTGANESTLMIEASGSYQLEVVDSAGCSALTAALNLVWSGITEKNGEIKIYPNPAFNLLSVEWNAEISPPQITLFNMLGEEVFFITTRQLSRQVVIDISELSSGMYFLRVGNFGIFKVVKA